MAEGRPDTVSKSAQELEQEITCGICHEHYDNPKIFPCCHYYCKECITKLAKRYRSQPFPCPDCREQIILPENDPDKLPTPFFINRMKDLHSRMEKAHGKVEAVCETCTGNGKSVAFCRQCAHFICEECVQIHSKFKALASHNVSMLDELKQGSPRALFIEGTPSKKWHKYDFVAKTAPSAKEKIKEQAGPLKELADTIQIALGEIKSARGYLEAQGIVASDDIKQYFKKLHAILDYREKELLSEHAELVKEKIETLCIQEKNISLSLATVQSLTEFVERTLANASNEEIMEMQTNIASRVEGEVVKQQSELSKPVEKELNVCVDLNIEKLMKQTCELAKLKQTEQGTGIFECQLKPCGPMDFYSEGEFCSEISTSEEESTD